MLLQNKIKMNYKKNTLKKEKFIKWKLDFFFISFNRYKVILPNCDKSFYNLLSLLRVKTSVAHTLSRAAINSADGPVLKNTFCPPRVSVLSPLHHCFFRYNIPDPSFLIYKCTY